MSKDLTQKLNGSLEDKVDRLITAVQSMDSRLGSLETKVDQRLRDTQPIWEAVQAQLAEIRDSLQQHGELLQQHLPADGPDYVLVRLDFVGNKEGETKRLRYDIVDKLDEATGLSAMMRTTAFPAATVSMMQCRGETSRPGVQPQEAVLDPDAFLAQLNAAGVRVVGAGVPA